MKNLSAILLLFACTFARAQDNEFKVYENGFIYSQAAMAKLGYIVDSLNLKYKTCDLTKKFYATSQTLGYVVHLDTGNVSQAKKDVDNKISFEEFVKKYPLAEIEKDKLITRTKYKNYKDEEVIGFEVFNLKGYYNQRIESADGSMYNQSLKNRWVFRHHEKSKYSKESLTAYYFPESFSSAEIPQQYALMIGYADCLIDTTTTKIRDDAKSGYGYLPDDWRSLSGKEKSKLLDDMRNTRVIGRCSQDESPRVHAMNIALLSAETYNWNVFLKAHLDIMNDRFERITDGSYAWGKRQTYIKELESLDINLRDLIFGISLQIENPATNHYFGDIGRIGRALAETQNSAEIEAAILSVVTDKQVDDYNRLVFYFLFKNYNNYVADDNAKKMNEEKLLAAVNTLPEYYRQDLLKRED